MRSVQRHVGTIRDASPPPHSRPTKRVTDGLETVRHTAQDHCPVSIMPRNRLRSRASAYGKPCASERCMHGLGGGVGVSSSEVSHAYPTETRHPAGGIFGARGAQRLEPGPQGAPNPHANTSSMAYSVSTLSVLSGSAGSDEVPVPSLLRYSMRHSNEKPANINVPQSCSLS